MAQPAEKTKVAPGRAQGGRRGRPTPDRAAAIDKAIRQAGLDLFLELGFEAASMDAIALKAGVSKGTLYTRYGNKEALFRAIIEDEVGRWSRRAGKRDHLLPSEPGARLRHHARTLAEVFTWPEYKRIERLLAAAAPALPDLAGHWEEIGTERYLEFLTQDLAKTREGAGVDWAFYAKVFLFAISGWHRSAHSGSGDPRDLMSFAERVITLIETGIAAGRRG